MKRPYVLMVLFLAPFLVHGDTGDVGFNVKISGFSVASQSVKRDGDNLLLREAEIVGLPKAFGRQAIGISGLVIRLPDFRVVTEGRGDRPFELSTAFGGMVHCAGLVLSNEGLYAREVSLALLPSELGGNTLVFPRLKINANGTVAISEPIEQAVVLNVAGFAVAVTGCTFDGKQLLTRTTEVDLDHDVNTPPVAFSGLSVTNDGLRAVPSLAKEVTFTSAGWQFTLTNLSLDATGVRGKAVVNLPKAFGSRMVEFPRFRLLPTGGFEADTADDNFFVRINDWKAELTNPRIDGNRLSTSNAKVRLYASMGDGEFDIPDIVLDSDGTIERSGAWTGDFEFLAENGFAVRAAKVWFGSKAISVQGDVYFPSNLGEGMRATYKEIELGADGCIETPKTLDTITYTFGEWPVEAGGWIFDRDGLHIAWIRFKFPRNDIEIDFTDLNFYADGSLVLRSKREVPINVDGFWFDVGTSRIGMSEVYLVEDGLEAKCYVRLPKNLGNPDIYFDKVDLDPDGNFNSAISVRDAGFSAGEMDVRFRNLRFNTDFLSVGQGLFTLPSALGGARIVFSNFDIDWNGQIDTHGLSSQPISIHDYALQADSLMIENGVVQIGGILTLAPESSDADGRSIYLTKLRFTTDGQILDYSTDPPMELSF